MLDDFVVLARMICNQSSRRIPMNTVRVDFIYIQAIYVKKGRTVGEAIMLRQPDELSIDNPMWMRSWYKKDAVYCYLFLCL